MNDGVSIPLLAFGTGTALLRTKLMSSGRDPKTARLDTDERVDREVVELIKTAVRVGYRHLDTAEMYQTEPELGAAIREVIAEGVVRREDLFVTTKISSEYARAGDKIDVSLRKLGLDYVDLYLIHTPLLRGPDGDLPAAWAALQAVKASGKARSIGVSGYQPEHLLTTLAAPTTTTPPSINQVELHPYLPGRELLALSRERGIAVAAYGALHPLTRNPNPGGPLDAVLERIAARHGVSVALVCLRWCVELGLVVVTTSRRVERMREYFGVFDFRLDEDEVRQISEAGRASLPGGKELVPRQVAYQRALDAQAQAEAEAEAEDRKAKGIYE
ncbi:Aldo/keto reductase [Cryphonectria parasitica EP155]|uniref:Aldo/keto reductase n=1 Tax=Cryphonectria parasitica (strain ATCC 38755 / EP155) TaxID=660469 RepID=A0A9P4Y619_CRYP1|nr:Aldo/keto reductase [Cryphonectria parasitica EP155]KAF3767213.1 Aldo/keto reductase [Cryphonectria parasitica EP155]